MSFLSKWFGTRQPAEGVAVDAPHAATLSADETAAIEKLIAELGNDYDIDGRIRAAEQLGAMKAFGDLDVAGALAAAGKKAARQFEAKRMTISMMHGIRPDQIDVKPHADDSRVTAVLAKVLRTLASRKGSTGPKSKAALQDLRDSVKSAEIRARVGL